MSSNSQRKRVAKTRYFGSEQYRLYSEEYTKEDAKETKRRLVDDGYLVRIVDDPRSGYQARVLVYVRKKSAPKTGMQSLADPRTWGW